MKLLIRLCIASLLVALVAPLNPTAAAQSDGCTADADHLAAGNDALVAADYEAATAAFTCAIEAAPTAVDAYRGRIEAALLSRAYAAALDDYTNLLTDVYDSPDAVFEGIMEGYEVALDGTSDDTRTLTGYSYALWWYGDVESAIAVLDLMLAADPDNAYAATLRGSSYLFLEDVEAAEADLAHALALDPENPDLYFMIADGYTYGTWNPEAAQEAALMANELGLDTPRLDAILGATYDAQGETELAAAAYARHIIGATENTIDSGALVAGTQTLRFSPGDSYVWTIEAAAGDTIRITSTSEADGLDTILAVMDTVTGTPVIGNDDTEGFNAGLDWTVPADGTYMLLLTTFEGAGTGEIEFTVE